jgi:hypothetical protein
MMVHSRSLFSFLLAVATLQQQQLVQASIAVLPIVTCQTQDLDGTSQEICFTYTLFGPSPAMLPNGTIVNMGPTGYDFEFWTGLEDGTNTASLSDTETHRLDDRALSVSWENSTCQVLIADEACSSCEICEEIEDAPATTTVTADCANIVGGRSVTCEAALTFYPFVAVAATTTVVDDNQEESESDSSGSQQRRGVLWSTMAVIGCSIASMV